MFPIYAMTMGGGVAPGVAPTLTSVSTSGGAVGDIDGGYPATLTGTGFTGATLLSFGGTAVTIFTVVNATTITCTVPAHATGAVSVLVTTPGGTNTANTAFEYFSPAQLSLTEWHRGSYASAPWAANASAGASSGRSAAATGLDPTAGTAINGKAPALFARASSQSLNASTANNNLFSTGAGSFVGLVLMTSIPYRAGSDYGDGNLCGDPSNAETTFGVTNLGFSAAVYTATGYKRADVAYGPGTTAWGCVQGGWDGTNVMARVNGGTEVTTGSGAYKPTASSTPKIGSSYGSGYLDGAIQEWMTSDTYLSTATRNKIRAYMNTRYFPGGAQV
ncbi:MAG: IPT/TIG domain-containing protein [Actinomycetota bacterium]|nr:IPT/TIG domain-containing protein [Actinomycetota bacterium]